MIVKVLEKTKGRGRCRSCGADIDWYTTIKGKSMPMVTGAVPLISENDLMNGDVIVHFDSKDTHWSNCPNAKEHKRG